MRELHPNRWCTDCERMISRKNLRRHMKNMHNVTNRYIDRTLTFQYNYEESWKCPKCDKKYWHLDNVYRHIREDHGVHRYQCTVCLKTFKRKERLDRHFKKKHEQTKYKCSLCNKVFLREDNMHRHIREVHEGKKYQYTDCKEKFNRQENLDRHNIETHKEAEYKCTKCDKTFTRKENLNRRIKNQHKDGKFKCKECDEILWNKEEYADHQKTHLQCNLCSLTFTNKSHLGRHFKESHQTTTVYKCSRPDCEKKFGQKSNQERHSKTCKK